MITHIDKLTSIAGNTDLILIPELSSSWVHVAAFYRVGSRDDPPGRTGMAHWLEHALCRRHHRGDQAQPLSASLLAGGYFSAFTLYDYTCYYCAVPAEHLAVPFDLEFRRMSGFEISPDELDKDRTIIDAERSYQEAHIAVRIGETTEQMAFTRHPYKWAPMGLREHLNAISADDIISYYETHYRPDNLTLVVAGDIKQEKIADYWSSGLRCLSLDKTQTPIARPWSGEEPVQKDYREWRTQESGPPYIHVLFKAPRAGSRDALAMMVISAALGGAKMSSLPFGPNRIGQEASILYRTLIRSEIATDIKCGYRRSLDPHAFDIMVTCNRNVETDLVLKSITDTIERISSIGLTEDELTHGKACVEAASRFRLEQGLGKVLEHGHAHSVDAYQRFANLNKELTSLKSSRIAEACRRYLDLDSASVGLNLPGRFEIKDVGGGD